MVKDGGKWKVGVNYLTYHNKIVSELCHTFDITWKILLQNIKISSLLWKQKKGTKDLCQNEWKCHNP